MYRAFFFKKQNKKINKNESIKGKSKSKTKEKECSGNILCCIYNKARIWHIGLQKNKTKESRQLSKGIIDKKTNG
jgi:hypothetical protein